MKLHNTLSHRVENFKPLDNDEVRIYTCGPTVYDHIHIGNFTAFIYADTLRRVLKTEYSNVKHAMNFTDVDDKTIKRSREQYPELDPAEALFKLTAEFTEIFLGDMKKAGNEVDAYSFVKATESIEAMQQLIAKLHAAGFAYIADDGVYFSIAKYRDSGKKYGQLLDITESSTSEARIQNDEYDKESAHDFALWKKHKDGEPSWDFTLDNQDVTGRPGWHIECSAMSQALLGQPFDIHSGGVDLIFPHHENEIAQSTALTDDPVLSSFFFHNEHLLIDGKKMSKSLQNFLTLKDIEDKGYDPLVFRLMVLQSHYRSQSNFSWDNLESARNRLRGYQAMADLRFQAVNYDQATSISDPQLYFNDASEAIHEAMRNDFNSPRALEILSAQQNQLSETLVSIPALPAFNEFLDLIDRYFGMSLLGSSDLTIEQKQLLDERHQSRHDQDWTRADEIRKTLFDQGIEIRDTAHGQIWSRL